MAKCTITNTCTGSKFTLSWGDYSIEIRNPQEDSRKLVPNNIDTKTRGKKQVIIGGFPVFEILHFKFRNISRAKLDEFLAFYETTAGEEITIINHCYESWVGVILSDSIKSTNYSGGLSVAEGFVMSEMLVYEFEFEFEGVKTGVVPS